MKAGASEWAEQAVTYKLACCGSWRPIQSLVHNAAQQVGSFCSHGHLPAHCSLCLLSLLGLSLSTLKTAPQNMGGRWEEGGGLRGLEAREKVEGREGLGGQRVLQKQMAHEGKARDLLTASVSYSAFVNRKVAC